MNKLNKKTFRKWNLNDKENLKGMEPEEYLIYAERFGYSNRDVLRYIKQGFTKLKGLDRATTRKERFSIVEGTTELNQVLSRKYEMEFGIYISGSGIGKYKAELEKWKWSSHVVPWNAITAKKEFLDSFSNTDKYKKKAAKYKADNRCKTKEASKSDHYKLSKLWKPTAQIVAV